MSLILDLTYIIAAICTAPLWIIRLIRTGKWRTDWAGRFGRIPPAREIPREEQSSPGRRRRVLLHAVSVGEVNAIRLLVHRLDSADTAVEVVVSTTTDTGYARAKELFGDRHLVVRYPFDVSWAVKRFLNAIRPDVVGLVELEVWPNFTAACSRQGIPLCVINGRLSTRSFHHYHRIHWLIRLSFRRLTRAAVQDERYAARFHELGVPKDRIEVTGTMKWDTAVITDTVAGAEELARELGIDPSRPLIVAGSTAPGEHELLHESTPPGVQLLCVPRKPEWFEQAATALPGCVRRSRTSHSASPPSGANRFLLDSMGELQKAYALADVVVVGRSFVNLHGSDMMEPIALGKATLIGPAHDDFHQMMTDLQDGDGILCVTRQELPSMLQNLLHDPVRRKELAGNGRAVILQQQGATARHAKLLLNLDQSSSSTKIAVPVLTRTAKEEKEERAN